MKLLQVHLLWLVIAMTVQELSAQFLTTRATRLPTHSPHLAGLPPHNPQLIHTLWITARGFFDQSQVTTHPEFHRKMSDHYAMLKASTT